MGRHRRSAAGRAATGRAIGGTDTRTDRTGIDGPYGPENLYGYAAIADLPSSASARSHRRRKAATPVRMGLLGASAAVALGTVAVAAGVVPGTENYSIGGGNADNVQAAGSPSSVQTPQGGTSGSADDDRDGTGTSRGTERTTPPAAPAPTAPSAAPTTPSQQPTTEPPATQTPLTPTEEPTEAPQTTAPVTVSAEVAAQNAVLSLVNVEREKVGCSPVAANSSLTELASAFSADMAARGFFDHTDPDGATPWDRAATAGIENLGGENIARGQATAEAVMEAWMNSPGHRANILNCDFKTLGVGVHIGTGGPWWTQDFGY